MATDFFDKILKDEHLKNIIDHYSPVAGEIMQALMIAYEKVFGENGSDHLFVWKTLEDLITRHENYGFYARTEPNENIRNQVLHLLTSVIYESGVTWLKNNGYVEPTRIKG